MKISNTHHQTRTGQVKKNPKPKYNIGRKFKDRQGNSFYITEYHSGFVWLRNERGLKQISLSELKHYKEYK